ncbi:nitroreductase family protein [Ancylomarina sp. 16SWW S1-10-2]|uniref:nitroreductase family protein n=1 Tax=Ancylomarina sp. 16SWW S1-10-2 TaxID=2499681 RepID=UPI0012AD5F4A|nr:nitroreductase family protein [Ancylomarina sp. 16SWW S1-10-2]MRT92310.1 NAD(P)H-dependent oxidoreductase [Ancylomarina sp. 16SWW S1-10-2]
MKKRILILAVFAGILGACTPKEKGETPKVSVGNQIIEDLSTRYTSKAYDKTKHVSPEDLATIEEVLRLSPSSINSQPWKFIVIKSDEAKQRFANTFENYKFNQPHAKNASEIILFANKVHYSKEDYKKRLDADMAAGRLNQKGYDKQLEGAFKFAEMVADENGNNGHWTKAQSYIALGNVLHALARLNIDSTPMEGVNAKEIQEEFAKELGDDYECSFALAIGYHKDGKDYNRKLPKSRMAKEDVITEL